MAGNDVWSLLTRQLYPSGENNDKKPRSAAFETESNEGDAADATTGKDADEATDKGWVIDTAPAFISYALCVGMPGAGKSSLLNTFLNPNNDTIPKPTVALEYMFARRASAANAPKDVAHIWELGGESHLSDLVRVPITPDRFKSALYVIFLDLSKPSSVVSHLLHWTDQIKACVKVCVRELSKRDPTFVEVLKKRTFTKFGRDHPDLRAVKPCPVPLVVVGNKYDIFKNQESVRKRTLVQALRFISHVNGASLLFCSCKDKKLKDVLRQTLNAHLFRSRSRRGGETNTERPIFVPSGSDSMDAILKHTPSGTRREDFVSGKSLVDGAMDAWKRAVRDVFGAADASEELPPANPGDDDYEEGRRIQGNDNPFPESSIDEHRAQREYRKDAERKAKLAAAAADAPRKTSHNHAGASALSTATVSLSKSSIEAKGSTAVRK